MPVARLASEVDFAGWRAAARTLRGQGAAPEAVSWTVDGDLFAEPALEADPAQDAFRVPRAFVDLAEQVIQHRSPERFSLLYRLLWRLREAPHLLDDLADPDVAQAHLFAKAVSRAAHKMRAFVRFREVIGAAPLTFAAWFEPAHRVTESTAPFFVRRFAGQRFSILTPDVCAHWDGAALTFTPGGDPADAPAEDALEGAWTTYYASIFNPARLKVAAMRKEMPQRYWRNLPEAAAIPSLIAQAQERTAQMVAAAPAQPSARAVKAAQRAARDGSFEHNGAYGSLEEVAAGVQLCRRCDLWRDATQGVPGEGAASARIMVVGEQPGDQEDLAGRPFVGPAGQMFDRACAQAGLPRDRAYVTNAVKHFKHEPRGKRRIHKTPNTGEVTACRWWLETERRLVRPRVILALGATAALSVFGKPTPIAANRGRALQLPDQAQAIVTYHPAFLLRLPDPEARDARYAEFVEDLKLAWSLAA